MPTLATKPCDMFQVGHKHIDNMFNLRGRRSDNSIAQNEEQPMEHLTPHCSLFASTVLPRQTGQGLLHKVKIHAKPTQQVFLRNTRASCSSTADVVEQSSLTGQAVKTPHPNSGKADVSNMHLIHRYFSYQCKPRQLHRGAQLGALMRGLLWE